MSSYEGQEVYQEITILDRKNPLTIVDSATDAASSTAVPLLSPRLVNMDIKSSHYTEE